MKLRVNHELRGERPCVVTIPPNAGKIYSPKKKEMYVMTLTKDNKLYFHGISKWMKEYVPERDFRLSLDAVTSYTIEDLTKSTRMYTLSTKEGIFFPIVVIHGVNGTYETDVNVEKFLSKMRSLGIKEVSLNNEE